MKKNLFYLFALICSISLFTGCSDSDDDPKGGSDDDLTGIAGTYQGDLSVTLDGIPLGTSTQQIYVTKVGDNNVKLELKDFSIAIGEANLEVGDIVIPNIQLAGETNKVELQESNVTINHPDLGELRVKVTGTIVGEKADFLIVVYAVTLDQNINVVFDGERSSKDIKDYSQEVKAWYVRQDLTVTGGEFDVKFPTEGIEVVSAGFNKIGIKSFTLTCFNGEKTYTRTIKVDAVNLLVGEDGATIAPVKQTLTHITYGDAEMVLTGKFTDNTLVLNINLAVGDLKLEYVYTGGKKNTGAEVEKMTIDNEVIVFQPETEVGSGSNKIIFFVKQETTDKQLASLVPVFEFSPGSTVTLDDKEYTAGMTVDFTAMHTLKVKSESGKKTTTYYITAQKMNSFKTNLDAWETKNSTSEKPYEKYEEPIDGWGTSNEGVKWIKLYPNLYANDAPYAVVPSESSKSGKAARLETLNTTGQAGIGSFIPAIPVVTSGTVFSGVFEVNILNTLKSTKFGYPCTKKPVAFKGSYKYTPGEVYYVCADPKKANIVTADANKTDAPALNAILFEVENYAADYLDGTNLLTSDKIVAKASVDGKTQAEYTDFSVNFDFGGKTFDSTKKYKLAIVCSSSKDGDKFTGAPGSVLYVDNLEVTF